MLPIRDLNRSYSTPIVTMCIIAINVAVFFYEVSLDDYSRELLIRTYGVVPARLEMTDLITCMFLHGGWMHMIGNMWFLWIFGDNVEDVLGHWRYLLFYLGCGIAAALAETFIHPGSRIPMIGASGAIAGVMGAYIMKFPHARIVTLVTLVIFFTTIEVPAIVMLGYWLLIQLFSGAGSLAETGSRGGTAFFAHIGGFLMGMLLIKLLPTQMPHRHRRDLHW